MQKEKYDLHCEFNIEKHKENYTNYLEVVIDRTGYVHYAVPSHQEFLINEACQLYHLTRDELNRLCPEQYYGDFMVWLCRLTGCVSVWNDFYLGRPNDKQINTLYNLKENGLFLGRLCEIRGE